MATQVVALVCEQVFEGKTVDQAFCLADIGDLADREDVADRVAKSVDGNTDLRAQTAARTPRHLIFGPLLGAGCRLVRPHNGGKVFEVRVFA
jgi:hypothetical protein